MDLAVLPFTVHLAPGYSLPTGNSGTGTSGANAGAVRSGPADVVAIGSTSDAGAFTAVTGDIFRLGDLLRGSAATGQSVAGHRIALGVGSGQLLLNNAAVPVDHSTFFTAGEFANLNYQAGDDQTRQSLVVVAQTGKLQPNGTLSMVADSQAVQITANVTGTRSINAMAALTNTPAGADANIVATVKEANVFTGIGSGRSTLGTTSSFTAVAGDTYRLRDLFNASAPTGQAVAGYRVALGAGSGQLLLNNAAVPSDHSTFFTAAEFAKLAYQAGDDQTGQSPVVVAQTGKLQPNGTLSMVADSQALQITASVTGPRSINAMAALTTTPSGTDENVTAVVKEAGKAYTTQG